MYSNLRTSILNIHWHKFVTLVFFSLIFGTTSAFGIDSQPFRPYSSSDPDFFWMGIVGDSSVTGILTHPSVRMEIPPLFGQLVGSVINTYGHQRYASRPARYWEYRDPEKFGIFDHPEPMQRIMFSDDGMTSSEIIERNQIRSLESSFDIPEFSFGYLVGRSLGIEPRHMVLAGTNEAKIGEFAKHVGRFYEMGTERLPNLILASYVGNDLCSNDYFHLDDDGKGIENFRTRYAETLQREFNKIKAYQPASSGTEIVFLSPLSLDVLLTNPELLSQKVPYVGFKSISCGDFRDGLPREESHSTPRDESGGFEKLALRSLKYLKAKNPISMMTNKIAASRDRLIVEAIANMCSGLLTPSDQKELHLERVQRLQEAQRAELIHAIHRFNNDGLSNIHIKFAPSVADIAFQKGDLANDCFHPGIGAHAKIAESLLENELKPLERDILETKH